MPVKDLPQKCRGRLCWDATRRAERTDFLLTADTILPETYLLLSLQQSTKFSAGGDGYAAGPKQKHMRQLPCYRAHLTAQEVWDEGKGRDKGGAASRRSRRKARCCKPWKTPKAASSMRSSSRAQGALQRVG